MNSFIDFIKENGVVGAGGAGFPTHAKLSANAEYIIVNGAECEPLIRVDQQLLKYYTKEFMEGLSMIVEHTKSKKAYVAIKSKHADVIEHLSQKISEYNYNNIEIYELDDFYPAGDEQITVKEVLNRVVPQGGIPLNVGCIVINVETVLNVYYSQKNLPVIKTFVTVTGDVPRPATLKLPIGISYREALKLCGTENIENKVLIDGGPMMGKVIFDFEQPITKTTKAVILLDKNHPLIRRKTMTLQQRLKQSKTACIQCARCTDLCPRHLLGHNVKPHMVMRVSNYGIKDLSGLETALGCSECGICMLYSCPSDLSPTIINSAIKKEFAKAGYRPDNKGKEYNSSSMFEYRKIPVKRLIERLNLKKYDVNAPMGDIEYSPDKVKIKLSQHIGQPGKPIVSVGQVVVEGEKVAEFEEGKLGANIHASIAGKVAAVEKESIIIERVMEVQ